MDSSTDIGWWRGLAYALAGFLVTRILVLVVGYCAPQDRARLNGPDWWSDMPLVRWDSGHYRRIMLEGYPPAVDGGLPVGRGSEVIAFFPGYPLVARLFVGWLGCDRALVVTSYAASLIGVLFLYAWCRRHGQPRSAWWCVWLLAAYPPAMFLSAGYADGLLFMCVAVILWLLDRQKVLAAACMSALATATRPTGLAVAAVVVIWAWMYGRRGPRRGPRVLRVLLVGAISVSGLVAFQAYLWHLYGRPDAFISVQCCWAPKRPVPDPLIRIVTLKPLLQPAVQPIKHVVRGEFGRLGEPQVWNPVFNLLILVLAVVGLVRPGNIPRVLFLLPILVFLEAYVPDPYRGSRLVGIARYHLVALPCFLLLAGWVASRWPWLGRYGLLAAMLGLQCLYVRWFADWRMVG